MNEEMHNLLGKYFSGQATENEKSVVEEWAASGEENASEFKLLQNIWTGYEVEERIEFDTEKAWQKVNGSIRSAEPQGAKIISFSKIVLGIAASFVIVVGLWWLIGSGTSKMQMVMADVDGKEVQLEDGSKVFLRKGSSLSYPKKFKGDSRSVALTGVGFFDVTKNPEKPFVITASDAEVKVLGTSFSVNTNNHQVELIVKTGKVSFTSLKDTAQKVFVAAGERALLSGNNISKSPNDDKNFDAWQSKELNFNNTPLQQLLKEVGHAYGVSISVKKEDSAQIANHGQTIDFRNETLEQVLQQIEKITSYQVKKLNDNHYEISIK